MTGSVRSTPARPDPPAAGTTADALDLVYHVLAIHMLSLAQAAELRGGTALDGFAPGSRALVRWVRERAEHLHHDRPLSPDIQQLSTRLEQVDWDAELEDDTADLVF